MDSYRLIINNYDESSVTAVDTSEGAIGYTVVTSPKGPFKPVLISSVAELHRTFGYPSKDYPELFEAETFIANGHKLYVCSAGEQYSKDASDENDEAHYIVVCDEGNFLAQNTIAYGEEVKEFIEAGDATEECDTLNTLIANGVKVLYKQYDPAILGKETTNSTSADSIFFVLGNLEDFVTLPEKDGVKDYSAYNTVAPLVSSSLPTTFNIEGFSKAYTLTIVASEGIVKVGDYTVGNLCYYSNKNYTSVGSKSASDIYNQVAIRFDGSSVDSAASDTFTNDEIKLALTNINNREKLVLSEVDTIAKDKIKALIFPKSSSASSLNVNISLPEATEGTEIAKNATLRNRLTLTVTGDFESSITIEGSLSSTDSLVRSFNEDGNSTYAQDIIALYVPNSRGFTSDDLTGANLIKSENLENTITIPAGVRRKSGTSNIEEAWAYASDSMYDDVNVFFDSQKHISGDDSTPGLNGGFTGLVSDRPLCGFIYNKTVTKSGIEDAETCSLGHNFWTITGLKRFTVTDGNGALSTIESPMTGAYAAMICKIIDDAYGGMAPMFLNSNGMGGQLSFPVGVSKSRVVYNYSSKEQKALEKKNYNPIIQDNTYGTMVTAQRTNTSGALTDWSYIGHVCSFLTFQREVRTNVMIPQLGKANNDYYRSLRAEQVSQILRYRLEGSSAIWNAATVDTSTNAGVNDTQAQKAKKFIINVRVKPEPYSEYVVLNFTNYNDSSTSEATAV